MVAVLFSFVPSLRLLPLSSSFAIVVREGWLHCKKVVLNMFAASHHLRRHFYDQSTPQNTDHLVRPSITALTEARVLIRPRYEDS